MPRNGSGGYSLPQPAYVDGTTISAAPMNSNLSDIASAMTGSVAADGQTPMSGNLAMGGNAITGASAVTATGIVGGGNIGRGALVRKTGTQSITTATTTALTWATATFDDATVWSIVTPSRLTVPAGFSRVMIMAGVLWSPNVSGYRQLDIRKNGALFGGSPGSTVQAITTADNMAQNVVSWCAATPGDYFEAYVYQNSGASLGIGSDSNSWFSIELLR